MTVAGNEILIKRESRWQRQRRRRIRRPRRDASCCTSLRGALPRKCVSRVSHEMHRRAAMRRHRRGHRPITTAARFRLTPLDSRGRSTDRLRVRSATRKKKKKKKDCSRVAFNDNSRSHVVESASKPTIIQRIADVRITVQAIHYVAVAINPSALSGPR